MLDEMAKSNIAAYSVSVEPGGSGLANYVANATGGFAFNAATFDRDLGELIDDLDHYYLVGFYPDDPNDKSEHPLEVRVNRPDTTVRFRRSYQPAGDPPKPKNKEPIKQLVEGVLPKTDLPLRLGAIALAPNAHVGARLALTLEVNADAATLTDSDLNQRDVLTYSVWAVNLDKKKPVDNLEHVVHVSLSPNAQDPVTTYQLQALLALPPGRYQLRASATSEKLGTGGSVYLDTEMPDFKHDDVVLGGIALGYLAGPRVPAAGDRFSKEDVPFWPTLDRDFSQTDTLRIVCDVARRKNVTETTMTLLTASGRSSARSRRGRLPARRRHASMRCCR